MEKLQKIIEDALASFNETNPLMNLVLFEDALIHVARINRILESPRGMSKSVGCNDPPALKAKVRSWIRRKNISHI